mgnify:CR=1 FL=1
MMQNDFEKALEQEIWSNRMIVLLEKDEGFVQVLFTPEHFNRVSDAVARGFEVLERDGVIEVFDMKIGEEVIPKEQFEGMRDHYEEDVFEA